MSFPSQFGQSVQQTIPQIQPQQSYQPQLPCQYNPTQVQWVQGEAGAKGFQLTYPNSEVYLRDSENPEYLYIKTTDNMGRPSSLKKFYMEEEPISDDHQIDTSNFVTREEFRSELESMFKKYMPQNQNKPPRQRNHNKGGVNNDVE